MLYFHCENRQINDCVYSVLSNKNISLTQNEDDPYFFILKIKVKNNQMKLNVDNLQTEISLPANINHVYHSINQLIINKKVSINDCDFFIFQQKLIFKNKTINLKNIHNLILNYLTLYKENGIEKHKLYSIIWPNDKDISINKLDSHLTNLKNEIFDCIGFNIQFNSNKKIIKLAID